MADRERVVECRECGESFTAKALGRPPAKCPRCRPQRRTRPKGAGSVYRNPNGTWTAQVEAGRYANGRRRYERESFPTEREALDGIAELKQRVEQGVTLDKRATVAEYVDMWLRDVAPTTGIKETTLEDYRKALDLWVKPHVGTVKVARLTPMHVQQMMRKLQDKGLAPATRGLARTVLGLSLAWGAEVGILPRNVVSLTKGPKISKSARLDDLLDRAEAERVLAAAADDRLHAFAVVCLRRGLRRGEALALRWADIDFEADELYVRGTLKSVKGKGLVVDLPKTRNAERVIPMGGQVSAALERRRELQQAERDYAGDLWHDTGFVFTRDDGRPIYPGTATTWWRNLAERAGLGRRRLHASRHTFATLALEDGVPLEVVSAVLGHANLSITADVYAKVSADSKRRRLAELDESLAEAERRRAEGEPTAGPPAVTA